MITKQLVEREPIENVSGDWMRRYELLITVSGQVVYDQDFARGAITWCGSVEQTLGYKPEELNGEMFKWLERVPPEDQSRVVGLLKITQNNGAPFELQHGFKHKDGRTLQVLHRGLVMLDWRGKPERRIGTLQDVSELRRVEEALKESEKKFHGMPIGFYRSTPSGQIIDANLALAELLGCPTPQALLAFNIADYYQDVEAHYQRQAELQKEDVLRDVEVQMRRRDGEVVWASETRWAVRDQAGQLQYYEASLVDIAGRKQAEEETRRRKEELEILTRVSASMRVARNRSEICSIILRQLVDLLKAGGAAFALCDPVNGGVVVELGYQHWESWTGRRLLPGEGISGLVISTGRAYRNNTAHNDTQMSAAEFFYDLTAVACVPLIAKEQSIGALWLGRDAPIGNEDMHLLVAIADMAASAVLRQTLHENLQTQLEALHRAQARLVQSEKLAALGELVAGVAHELNNPLTSVMLYAQLLQARPAGEEIQTDLDKIVLESRRATNIVRKLLDFARQRTPERKPVQINAVLKSSLDFLEYELASYGIQSEVQAAADLPITLADPHQLQQVFVNLANNARQAMSPGHGTRRLKVSTELGHSHFFANLAETAPVIRVTFEDEGPGIPAEIMTRIFDPFFTTKPEGEGTGLGLSVCHGIVSEHGGHIWAENRPEGGAVFVVELPVIQARPEAIRKAPPPVELPAVATARILVIEDEANVLEVIARALQRKGYTVKPAGSGMQGLECLAGEDYDLILCDMRIPEMSGPDFYREVCRLYPHLKERILFMSGDTISAAIRRFLEETGVAFLAKPFEMNDLIEKVVCLRR
ncbi:MAG: ATP-binding protein [Anaerolineaceae bacterium]|nr:ATP-binding protein [Anaerolineaceae bacterium]